MDSKRKANGGGEDSSAKRRKIEDFDLTQGESSESTTAYGHAFLELLRRTADKSGRQVAATFESLPPRATNKAYYKATALPISLEIIEEKLDNGDFQTLSELEGYFKRMISNAKEFFPRGSGTHEDAERIRKTLSNFMTKRNPAYLTRGYQAVATPVSARTKTIKQDENEEDANEEEEDEQDDDEEEEEAGRGSKRKSIILKRRGSNRTPRSSTVGLAKPSPRINPSAKPDHQYENVPYKGLSFQEAQEKVVEELIRYTTPDYDDAYYEPFINLPPRQLKDYYKMISDPLSLRKLQKHVKGAQGRGEPTGVSEFKTWNAFQEKSSLLWENAYYYNEEDSDIHDLAQELEKHFLKELKAAKAVVSEPAQPKIKLKVGQNADTPVSNKKITIHVGGRGATDSPAPASADVPTDGETNGTKDASEDVTMEDAPDAADTAGAATNGARAGDGTYTASGLSGDGTTTMSQFAVARPPVPVVQPQPVPHISLVEPRKLRRAGHSSKDALISNVRVQTYTGVNSDRTTALTVLPNPWELTQSAIINLQPHETRVLILVQLPGFLSERQFNLWALLDKGPLRTMPNPYLDQKPNEKSFDLMLRPGMNVFEAHLVAAIPKEERKEGGAEIEVEIFTVMINVLRN